MRNNRVNTVTILCLLILVAGSLLHIFAGYSHGDMSGHAWGSDDAYISYRYTQNLVEDHGLVYNPGEKVEGYSNFLYILMLAPLYAVSGVNGMYIYSTILNLILAIAAFLLFCFYIRNRFGENAVIAAALLFAFCLPIWAAVASGMESTLVLLIQLVIWIALERYIIYERRNDLILIIVLSILSILARADGFVFPVFVILYLLLKGKRRSAIYCALSLLIAGSAYFLWRYSYYGDFLPNTYYAKVSGSLSERVIFAIRALGRVNLRNGLIFWIFLPAVLMIRWLVRVVQGKERFITNLNSEFVLISGMLVYWIYVGGDIYDDRFLIILVPLGISLFLKFIWPYLNYKRITPAVLSLLILIQLTPLKADQRFRYSYPKYDCLVTLGRYFKENYPDKTLATMAAGKVPFYSGMKTIDMLGLTDRHIAHTKAAGAFLPGHNKYDHNYILSRKPDLIFCAIDTNFALYGGFSAQLYNRAGYQLKFLLNMNKKSQKNNILDIKGFSPDTLRGLIYDGYEFAVLEKVNGS